MMSVVGFPYIALYSAVAIVALLKFRLVYFWIAVVAVFIFLAFRHEISTDWPNYLSILDYARGVSVLDAMRQTDPAYGLINWLGANWFGGIYFVNFVCAIFAVVGLAYFCSRMPEPLLAFAVAIPYLVVVVYAGATRQGVATGLAFVALLAAIDQKPRRFVLFLLAATLFHKSAFLMLIFLPFSGVRKLGFLEWGCNFLLIAAVATFSLWPSLPYILDLYVLRGGGSISFPGTEIDLASQSAPSPLQGSAPSSLQGEEVEVHSTGAVIRSMMTVVASAALVALGRADRVPEASSRVWHVAILASFVLFVFAFFYSTMADRLGYYLIAIQIFAFSSLPAVVDGKFKFVSRVVVLAGYGFVLFVWLNFGDHAVNWLPYRSILLN